MVAVDGGACHLRGRGDLVDAGIGLGLEQLRRGLPNALGVVLGVRTSPGGRGLSLILSSYSPGVDSPCS